MNWNFGLVFGWGGNTTHIHDFCIPLDFLGIKDLKKNEERPKYFSKAIAKATATFIEILFFLPYVDHFDIRIQAIEGI